MIERSIIAGSISTTHNTERRRSLVFSHATYFIMLVIALIPTLIPMCSYSECSDLDIVAVEAQHLGELAVVRVKVKNTGDTFGYLNNWTVEILPVIGGRYSFRSWEQDDEFLEWNANLSETSRRTSRVDVGEVKGLVLYSGPWLTDYKGAVVKITIHITEPMCAGPTLHGESKFP